MANPNASFHRIRTLRIRGFRGFRSQQTIDLTSSSKSFALFGKNGSGKSSIADAVEWFFTSAVEHLWAEDCRSAALRNIHEVQDAEVEISLQTKNKGTRTLSATLKNTLVNSTPHFTDLVECIAKERIVLRHADIVNFIVSSKKKKREEIESIIGYDKVKKFRDLLRQSIRKLEGDAKYVEAKTSYKNYSEELSELTGVVADIDSAQLIAILSGKSKKFNLQTRIVDSASFYQSLTELRAMFGDREKADKHSLCKSLTSSIHGLKKSLEDCNSLQNIVAKQCEAFLQDETAIFKLQLGEFLRAGSQYVSLLEDEMDDVCPFCLNYTDINELRDLLPHRLAEIDALFKQYQILIESKNQLRDILSKVLWQVDEVVRQMADCSSFLNVAFDFNAIRADLKKELEGPVFTSTGFAVKPMTSQFLQAIFTLASALNAVEHELIVLTAKFALSKLESEIIDHISSSQNIVRAFKKAKESKASVGAYENVLKTLKYLYEDFIQVQNVEVQRVLDAINNDVNRLFNILHPSSIVDSVQLKLLGEQGVEFSYNFHGQETYPPRKYLSESFLNSLGIVLFLASAKLFNKSCRFVVLDDVVTSFDKDLRRRVLRMLDQEFQDWQIFLLTHEEFWFEMMKRELPHAGWLFNDVKTVVDNGSVINASSATIEMLIEQRDSLPKDAVIIRQFLEQFLKEICFALQVGVAFRYNEHNENRMCDELLNSFQRAFNSHKCSNEELSKVIAKLKSSLLITNRGSHNSSVDISEGDLSLCWDDIMQLRGLLKCESCNRLIEAKNKVVGQNIIACRCGSKTLYWS